MHDGCKTSLASSPLCLDAHCKGLEHISRWNIRHKHKMQGKLFNLDIFYALLRLAIWRGLQLIACCKLWLPFARTCLLPWFPQPFHNFHIFHILCQSPLLLHAVERFLVPLFLSMARRSARKRRMPNYAKDMWNLLRSIWAVGHLFLDITRTSICEFQRNISSPEMILSQITWL